jgi:hypothetical protein
MSSKQGAAARKNIKKAANATTKKRTIAHLPKSVRTALGKKRSALWPRVPSSEGSQPLLTLIPV